MKDTSIQILLTNDDGIRSPGLWAAAEALEALGYVTVVAPREQSSGMGRSLPSTSDGIITPQKIPVNGREWTAYAVGGTPAQAVLHGVLEVLPRKPDLVVSGINYGANVGLGITISGTVGAALEAAGLGIPAIAISLDTPPEEHLRYSREVDFSAAAHFCTFFAARLLDRALPDDVHVLKVEIPAEATPETPWEITRLARIPYYEAVRPQRKDWDQPVRLGYRISPSWQDAAPESDVHTLYIKKHVSVTPLTLDMTAPISPQAMETWLRADEER
ncbi:MAG: 5'/3'-nucleotidase SurE [Anaerolineae bacterium]|nr:MAG: 5'/3'-nucleotidase SurE [Anaerolineae bacterium]